MTIPWFHRFSTEFTQHNTHLYRVGLYSNKSECKSWERETSRLVWTFQRNISFVRLEKEEEEKNKVASNCGMELAFSLIFLLHFVQVVHQFQKSFKLTDGNFMMAFDWVDVFLSWWGKYNNEISFEKNTKTLVPRAEIFPIWMLLGNRFHLQ